jgi:polyhydroxybutyrate depolymerase
MAYGKTRDTMSASLVTFVVCFSVLALNLQDAHSRDPQAQPGSHALAVAVNGLERSAIVHVPAAYTPQTPSPLVVMLHGGGGTARAALWETEWAVKAEKEGFLVAFPNARARDPAQPSSFAGNPQLWNDGSDRFYPGQKAPDDVGFIAALLDELCARFAIDRRRVFVTGFSNGASMGFRVGAELSHRIAAIAPVAGALWFDPPVLKHPVSMCYITGTADPLNPIEGGLPRLATGASDSVRAKPKPPVRDSILKWARALGCPETPAGASDANGVHTETYAPCAGAAEVVYIAVDGQGHTWAGGRSLLPERMVGKTSNKLRATDVIWEFFQKHPRPLQD